MLLMTLALFACGGASPPAEPSTTEAAAEAPPAAQAPKADAAPDAPTPAAKPWRVAFQYGTQETASMLQHALLYDRMRNELMKHGIFTDSVRPPYGSTTVYDAELEKLGSLDLAGLPQGDYGWIYAEQGREPLVIPSPNVASGDYERPYPAGDSRPFIKELEGYFGITVGF